MAGNAKKWFVGCSIGCGLMLLVVGGLGTGGYFMIRKAMDKGEEIESVMAELEAAYGCPSDFVPGATGVILADRMETFLAIREIMAPVRTEASEVLRTLHEAEEGTSDQSTLDKVRAGLRLIPVLMGFVGQRNQTLLDQGMGLGEYLYIYSLSYFVMLDKDPADGPSFTLSGDDHDDEEKRVFRFSVDPGGNNDFDRQERAQRVRDYLNGIQAAMIRSQAAAWSQQGEDAAWQQSLQTELALMEEEPYRLLWEEGLPAPLRNSLEPYWERLDVLYDEMTNILDCGMVESD